MNQIIQEERAKYQNLDQQYQKALMLEITVKKYEEKIAMLTQEIERLNNMDKGNKNEIDQLR